MALSLAPPLNIKQPDPNANLTTQTLTPNRLTQWLTQYRTYGTGKVKVIYNGVLHPSIVFFPGSLFPLPTNNPARPPPYATKTHEVIRTYEAEAD